MATEPKVSGKFATEPPPGMLPNGKLNVVQSDDPPQEIEIVDDAGKPIGEAPDDAE